MSILIQASKRMQANSTFLTEATCIRSSEDLEAPDVDDSIEFMGDMFTDKGPAVGSITRSFVTVDGPYITVKFADGQETISWDDLTPYATKPKTGCWIIQKSKVSAFTINLKKTLEQS